jgi:hypothetical protein
MDIEILILITYQLGSWGSSVSIATRIWAGQPEFDSSRARDFLLATVSILTLGPTQLPIQWVPGALSPGVKWLRCVVDHSPPYCAKAKGMCSYTLKT